MSDFAQGEKIDCAFGEVMDWTSSCILEPIDQDTFVIHHPDGSSYRYRFADGAPAIVIADGAEPVIELRVEHSPFGSSDDRATIKFSSNGFHYRLSSEALAVELNE